MPDAQIVDSPLPKIQTKIYQTIERRASSTKQTYKCTAAPIQTTTHRDPLPVRWRHSRQSTMSFSLATVARPRTWSRRHNSQDLRRQSIIFGRRPRGFVESLAEDNAPHRIAMSQTSYLPTSLTVNRPSLLSLRRRRSLRLVTMMTEFVRRIT